MQNGLLTPRQRGVSRQLGLIPRSLDAAPIPAELEIAHPHGVAVAEDDCATDRLLQLAHVAGPGVARERRERLGDVRRGCGRPCRRAARARKCAASSGMSSRALAQRRHADRHHARAGSRGPARKRPPRASRPQDRGWSRRSRARPPARAAVAPTAAPRAPGARAAASPARAARDRPPRRGTACRRGRRQQRPRAAAVAPVNAPALVAEQLALEQRLGVSAAQLIATNGSPVARARGVERPRDQLLARAALAQDQHRGLRRPDPLDPAHQLPQAGAASDELVATRVMGEATVSTGHPRGRARCPGSAPHCAAPAVPCTLRLPPPSPSSALPDVWLRAGRMGTACASASRA